MSFFFVEELVSLNSWASLTDAGVKPEPGYKSSVTGGAKSGQQNPRGPTGWIQAQTGTGARRKKNLSTLNIKIIKYCNNHFLRMLKTVLVLNALW